MLYEVITNMLDNKLSLALHEYSQANYTEAINLFDQVLKADNSNPVSNFYQGMSYQELGKYENAIGVITSYSIRNNFV